MQSKFLAFIDSFDSITILLDKSLYKPNKKFYTSYNAQRIELPIKGVYEEYLFFKYIVEFQPFMELHKEYKIEDELCNATTLRSGSVVRTKEFEERYRYDGPLGFEYSKEKTSFRIWSPVAKEIIIELKRKDSCTRHHLEYISQGLWQLDLYEDLEGCGYIYYVRVFDEFVKINDPYALASSANAKYNYVIDINKLYRMKNPKPSFSGKYVDAIVYEASIRDFTASLKSESRGTFEGMYCGELSDEGNPTGLEYIASLGVSHLQILPTYDFGGVNDNDKSYNCDYNWGYNPEQYFIPCGWYSKNPDDPYSRINELLMLIDKAHEYGLRIVMDVVFNHVYKCEVFAFDNLVPGYFFRVEMDGRLCNAAGCGNVIATEKYMASRFVMDVLDYYARLFKVSGYRFDLMGLLDIDTLNHVADHLRKIDKTFLLYGEGWNMMNPLPDHKRPHMYNHNQIPCYAFFNDRFRDIMRGNQWNEGVGLAFGELKPVHIVNQLLLGSCIDYFKFDEPYKSINYVECHDNYTMYDYGKYKLNKDKSTNLDSCRLALEIILISEGIPFIHGGEEFFRTKKGVENSYNSNDDINRIDYTRRDRYIQMVNTLKDIISIRKEYSLFRLRTKKEIEDRIHFLSGMIDEHTTSLLLEDRDFNLIVVGKNDYMETKITYEKTKCIFDGFRKCDIQKREYVISRPGIYIFRKEKK